MHAHASAASFKHMPEHVQARYVELLRQLHRLGLGCRCELVGGKDFHITVGYGLATAQFWLDMYDADRFPVY